MEIVLHTQAPFYTLIICTLVYRLSKFYAALTHPVEKHCYRK